ncbi:nicotinate (nicotinamide) nucleotide adenylyltransferase [Poriferisphaera sp. WC338]|uniref:nicotinate (nicotinamide) nucleotide adenylyltransferase n=1 Tax=Poriferisphaera sp. WC338 TaxID=3425129 RepID=UPI003D818E7F
MDLSAYQNIVVFGGSFDPPHVGHVKLPQLVREKLVADLVLYIPAGRAPHKLNQVQTSAEHRLSMLELALADQPHTMISDIEIDRAKSGQPSYTVDTLEEIHKHLAPGAQLRLLIGADQLLIFESWHRPERIIELAEPVVMVRPPETKHSLIATMPEARADIWATWLLELPQINVSSSEIRSAIESGADQFDEVPPAVMDYIKKHHLYGR